MTDPTALVKRDLVVETALEICRRPSLRPNEKAVADYLGPLLERLGFEVELQEVVKDRPNVVAIARGSPDHQSFLFNGHLDHSFPFGQWKQDPFQPWIEGDALYGAGLQDMKGGVAAMVAGAAAVLEAGLAPRGDVIVTIVMHHDTIGLGTKYFLAANDWRIDAAVCGEPTNIGLQVFHGGAWDFEIRARGVARHQARLEEGVNAIVGLLRVVERLDVGALTYTPDPRYPHLPRLVVGNVEGGRFAAYTAEEAVARGNVRYLPGMTIDGMKADVRRVIARVAAEMPGLSGDVRTTAFQRPYSIAPDAPVVQSLVAAHRRVTGRAPAILTGLPSGAFITDAADLVRAGIPTAIYGPAEWQTEPNEHIPIDDLVTAARVYAATCADVVSRRRSAGR